MKTVLMSLIMLVATVPAWGQYVRVDMNPNVKVDMKSIARDVAISVMNDFDFDLNLGDESINLYDDYQESTQEVEIPLSKPGERGMLDVQTHNGKIKVTGYDGPTVKVKMTKYEKKVEKDDSKNGMRLVSSGGFNFEASEKSNVVKVENEGWNDRVDFEIMVPKNFDIKADAYNNGYITVSNINGQIDAESYNGPISLTEIGGSVTASTYNGAIQVTFTKVTPDTPMAFSTYNGDVDISVPSGVKFSTKMKTSRDIFTDFESFAIKQAQPVTNKGTSGGFKVKYENWVEGDLNGGGAEIMMKTTNGNIYIRKK